MDERSPENVRELGADEGFRTARRCQFDPFTEPKAGNKDGREDVRMSKQPLACAFECHRYSYNEAILTLFFRPDEEL